MTSPQGLEISLAPTAASVRLARDAIGEFAGLPPHVAESARLAVSELVTNSIRHGAQHPPQPILLRARRFPSHLRIDVINQASGDSAPHICDGDPLRASGRGLAIIDTLTSRWGTETTDETTVWCEIAICA
jgi:anti-sigma regulatory factor (Ser/Thr protein kinase)